MIELGILALFIRSSHKSMAFTLEPLSNAQLIFRGAQQLRDFFCMLVTLIIPMPVSILKILIILHTVKVFLLGTYLHHTEPVGL